MVNKKTPKAAAYTPAPRVNDPELLRRYELALKVLTGQLSVKAAAKQAGLSRLRFQTLMHRAQAQLLSELAKKPAGRPAKSETLRELETRNRRLERRTEQLEQRMAQQESLLKTASELIRDQLSPPQSPYTARRTRRTRTTKTPDIPDDDDGPSMIFAEAQRLRAMGLARPLIGALAGRAPSTLRRWARRERAGLPLVTRRGPPRRSPDPLRAETVAELVRESRGLLGAVALSRSVPGISRRDAARVKAETLTAIERARKAESSRVSVLHPGVIRGFDGMSLNLGGDKPWILAAGDAAVPFRTSLELVDVYDGDAVEDLLESDFERYGAPLVLRLDRAKQHRVAGVRQLCARYGVLILHGPPHCPRFYGQQERQNREHRAWLDDAGCQDRSDVVSELGRMRVMLNSRWPRRTLKWHTAEDVWTKRPQITLDRARLRDDVAKLTASITESLDEIPYPDFAERLAIEVALTRSGLLRREERGDC